VARNAAVRTCVDEAGENEVAAVPELGPLALEPVGSGSEARYAREGAGPLLAAGGNGTP